MTVSILNTLLRPFETIYLILNATFTSYVRPGLLLGQLPYAGTKSSQHQAVLLSACPSIMVID